MSSYTGKVLLIAPKFGFDAKVKKQSIFPFGLGYIAACLQKAGYAVDVWDLYSQKIDYAGVQQKIHDGYVNGYAHIGITGMVSQYLYVTRLAEDIKRVSNAVVTVGGPLATYSSHLLLKHAAVDVCVLGHGEETYVEVVAGKPLREIHGLAFRNDAGEPVKTPPREMIKNLDDVPYPAYELFDMEFYLTHTNFMDVQRQKFAGQKTMGILTGRGCPYQCRFCSKSLQTVRYKSIDYLVKEITYYQKKFDVHHFHFIDELVVISKKRTLELCEKLKPLNIIWDAQGRVNLVDRETLSAMKDAGCVCVGFGVESGSRKILENMNKQITPEQIKDALTICREIHLASKIQLIFGYPGEDNDTLEETIQLFKEVRYPARRLGIITPLPGSPLYETAKADGFLGDGPDAVISEEAFHHWLSEVSPFCNQQLFYNRTAFSDQEFFEKHAYIERQLVRNFLIAMLLHPLFFWQYRDVYNAYLLNWWNHRYKKKARFLFRILHKVDQLRKLWTRPSSQETT